MARARTIEICVLNIAMHSPHSPDGYVNLFKDAYALNRLIYQGELHGLMLGSLETDNWQTSNIISGEIFRFVQINQSDPWFNLETSSQATPNDVRSISIPSHLLAHLQRIRFIFSIDLHKLWFISKDRDAKLGPLAAHRFFETLFNQLDLRRPHPDVEVTVLPDKDTLSKVFGMHKLKELTIEFKRPNPDDGGGVELDILQRLEALNAKSEVVTLVANKSGSLVPDDSLKKMAEVAAENGSVTAIGETETGLKATESTTQKPMRIYSKVMDSIETTFAVLKRMTERS